MTRLVVTPRILFLFGSFVLMIAPAAIAQPGVPQYPGSGRAPASPPPAAGASQQPTVPRPAMQQPIYRVATTPNPPQTVAPAETPGAAPAGSPAAATANPSTAAAPVVEHPLMPALRWAQQGLPQIQSIEDYQGRLYKRERIDGQLGEYQMMFIKVRHRPFSVYMYFEGPAALRGQECIYVAGQNEGNLQAHATGLKNVVGTVSLSPTGRMAMRGNRYPITELGVANLVQRLLQVGERDTHYGECDVQFQKAKVGGRSCTCITVNHPVPRRNFLYHLARIYVDDEMNLPIRYESFDWPVKAGGEPQLLEEYTYQNLKLNNGFTDADFSVTNPKYGFR